MEFATFEPRDLGTDECSVVLELFRGIRRPDLDSLVMRRESVQMLLPLGGSCGIAERSVRKRTVKITIRWEPEFRRQPFQAGCDIDGGSMVAGMKVRLQSWILVPTLGCRREMIFTTLIKVLIVKRAEVPGHPAQHSYQPELRGDDVNDQPELRLLRKIESMLGFGVHLDKQLASREKILDQIDAAIPRRTEITARLRDLGTTTPQLPARPEVHC